MTNQGNLWLLATLLAAPCVGSYLGIALQRGPLALGRSRCESCGATLGAIDLVPIVSFLLLRGRCRTCHARIPTMLLLIEGTLLLIAVIAAGFEPAGPELAIAAGLGAVLFALALIDLRSMRLPDALTLPLLLCGLLVCFWTERSALTLHAAAAALDYLGLRLLAQLYRRSRGIEGIGAGDAKLLAAGGAWLGLAAMPDLLVLSGSLGIVGFMVAALRRGRLDTEFRLPFGPALALAIWLLWLHRGA